MNAMKTVLVAALACSLVGAQAPPQGGFKKLPDEIPERYFNPKNFLSEKETSALLERILFTQEPFRGSWMEKTYRNTVGHFFTPKEYDRLRGNPALGYTYIGSFTWLPSIKEIEFVPFQPVTPEAQCIRPEAWRKAAEIVCRRMGLTIKQGAPIKVSGAVIGVNRTRPLGVYTEVRVQGPTGTLLYRGGTGKATLGDAVGANLEYVIAYAHGVGDGRNVSREEAEAMLKKVIKKAGVK